jgi:ElaB/YqjD/DUF883 family membrane-anchored ribosome-binding protein
MDHEERIQQEMQETRADLAQKLAILEEKVAGTVVQVTTAVTETVEAIKDTVQDTKATVGVVNETVQESVRSVQDSLNVSKQVQAHPWWMMAGSVAAGFCLGTWLGNRLAVNGNTPVGGSTGPELSSNRSGLSNLHRNGNGSAQSAPAEERGTWAPEIDKLKGLALGALFGAAREMVASSLPEPVNEQVREIIDSVTQKAGGKPIPSTAFANVLQAKSTPQERQLPHGNIQPEELRNPRW